MIVVYAVAAVAAFMVLGVCALAIAGGKWEDRRRQRIADGLKVTMQGWDDSK